MEPDRWRQVGEVVSRALATAPEERSAAVASACGDDRQLRAEVESLLAADERAESILGGVGRSLAEALHGLEAEMPEPPRPRTGERFGAYVAERSIGRGGMGEVYLGRRADRTYEGRVAIKVMAGASAGEDLARRFHQERQILAGLDHPHVARLLDAGTSTDGAPFFVMEYVEGTAIDEWCDRRRQPVAERIRLFLKVLDAVQAAHRALVVHRDLKPANVRVTPDGVPKLLDFGIAKLLDSRGFPHAAEATLTALRPMTLTHASPEQITGGPITTATDVYGLGVTLYRLLTGCLPYSDGTPLPHAIVHDDPIPASARVTRDAARERGVEAAQLRRLLAGDLDVILQTALAKEPSRRYGSAEAFAADLDRHLRGLPVAARRPTFAYRAAKLARRNPGAATLAVALVAALTAFAVSMGLLAGRLADERDRAEAARLEAEGERDRALREELETQQVAALLVDLFSQPDPARSRGAPVLAREVLDRGVARVTRELADQPRVQAELLATMGQAYHGLGLYHEAAPLLERAVEIRQRTLGPDHPETLDGLSRVAASLFELGEFERAAGLYRQVLDDQIRVLGPESPRVADTMERLGTILQRVMSDFSEAEALLERALAIRRALPDDQVGLAGTLHRSAMFREVQGRAREAETLYREAYSLRRRILGSDHPRTLSSQKGMANTLRLDGRFAEAEEILRRILERERRVFGENDERIPFTLTKIGFSVLHQGRATEAESYFRDALRIRREVFGEDHPAVVVSLTYVGIVLQEQGRLRDAEALYRRAVETGPRAFPAGSHQLAPPLLGLGEVLTARGAAEEAEPLLRKALELRRNAFGPDNLQTAEAESALAECLASQGTFEEARQLLLHAASIQRDLEGEYRRQYEQTLRRLEAVRQARRR